MDKEKLMEMGLTEQQATQVLKELDGNFVTKARFNEVNGELTQARAQVKERDTQMEGLKKSTGDVEGLKQQIETLLAENKAKEEAHASEIKQLKVDAAVEAAIMGAKGKNARAIKALLDLSNPELAEDGTIKGLGEQMEKLTKADDSKFLFATEERLKMKGVKPGESSKDFTGEPDLTKMSYEELCNYYEEHPNNE